MTFKSIWHYTAAFIAGLLAITGCKTTRVLPTSPATDTVAVVPSPPADTTTYYVTATGDTLETLGEEVDKQVFRLMKDTVSIIGVGDIMMGTNYPDASYLPPGGAKSLWAPVFPVLQNADVTFGNLEGVLLNKGGIPKYCSNPKLCYLFRTPDSMATHLVTAGFDLLSMANNHAGDFGQPGRNNTKKVLDSLGIAHAGLLSTPSRILKQDGMIYGFAAFAPNTGTMSINKLDSAKQIIAHLDSLTDIVIVSFHGGAEGSKHEHVTRKREIFYGENRGNVYNFAHELINSGADVVFGHGPHVTRAIEVYQNRFIIYSLGNFCTYARFNLRGPNGLAPIVKVYTDSVGAFRYAEITPIVQRGEGGPVIDDQKRVIKKIKKLTDKDFPEHNLTITDEGLVVVNPGNDKH